MLTLLFALAAWAEPPPGAEVAQSAEEGSAPVQLDRNGKPVVAAVARAGGPRTAHAKAAGEAFTLDAATATSRRYAMRQTFTSQMKNPNPFSPSEWRSTHTSTWAVVEWREQDGKVEWKETTCGVKTDPVFGAQTVYTPAFVAGVPVRFRAGSIAGHAPGDAFRAGPFVQEFGVSLGDPFVDPLPRTADDPRLVDDDGDGLPGVTVVITHPMMGTGKVWIAQRSVARLEGKVGEGGRITGNIRTAPDMYKIDGDTWWLRADSPQRPHPDPSQSPFVMVPVGPEVGCPQVLASQATLFPPLPALD